MDEQHPKGASLTLHVRARFGKRDGVSDYCWLTGSNLVTPDLRPLCEALAQLSAKGSIYSVVAQEAGALWLICSYLRGVDDVMRPIVRLFVAEITCTEAVERPDWLGIAWFARKPEELNRLDAEAAISMTLPVPASAARASVERATLARARLGIPIALRGLSATGLSVMAVEPWRYAGVCYAVSAREDDLAPWSPALARFVCVNTSEPPLSKEDEESLRAATALPPSATQWAILNGLDAETAKALLRWSVCTSDPLPLAPGSSIAVRWLVAFYGDGLKGAPLLRAIRSRFDGPLTPEIVKPVAPELSVQATELLCSPDGGGVDLAALEELAAGGYLTVDLGFGFWDWARFARQSRALTDQAIMYLSRYCSSVEAAQLLLDLDVPDAAKELPPEELEVTLHIAERFGISAPRRRLLALLGRSVSELAVALLNGFRERDRWAEAMARLVFEGEPPSPGLLSVTDLAAGLDARERRGASGASLHVIAALVRAGRVNEAADLLSAEVGFSIPSIDKATRTVLVARLGRGPRRAPPGLEQLKVLVQLDLARPEDIELSPRDFIPPYAQLWPETRALAALFIAGGRNFPARPPGLPPGFVEAARASLLPVTLERWLAEVPAEARPAIRAWTADLIGFDRALFELLAVGEALPYDAEALRAVAAWIHAMIEVEPRSTWLQAIRSLTLTRSLRGDDRAAEDIFQVVSPALGGSERAVVVFAASGVGPMPPLDGLVADLLEALLPALDPVEVVNALFVCSTSALTSDPILVHALLRRLRAAGAPCPERGFTSAQVQRHMPLAAELSALAGWERISPEPDARARFAYRLLKQLGLSAARLSNSNPDPVASDL